jgi:hypothetical protein
VAGRVRSWHESFPEKYALLALTTPLGVAIFSVPEAMTKMTQKMTLALAALTVRVASLTNVPYVRNEATKALNLKLAAQRGCCSNESDAAFYCAAAEIWRARLIELTALGLLEAYFSGNTCLNTLHPRSERL